MDVGFIGLGQMGAAMAGQLIEGHRLSVWNRDAAKAAAFAVRGTRVAVSPADAAMSGIVVSMLADDAAVEAVVFEKNGLLSVGPGLLHVSCSTVSVALTDRLTTAHRDAGQRFVSAQVLGRPNVAAAGELSIIAAGTDEDLALCQPLFEAMGQRVLRMGAEPGMAAAAKLAANVSIAAVIEIVTEAFAIAGGRGVEPSAMLDLFTETNFGTRMFTNYGKLIVAKTFTPAGFPMRLGRKDVGFGLDAAGADAELPLARLIAARMDRLIEHGDGDRDWSALGQPPSSL